MVPDETDWMKIEEAGQRGNLPDRLIEKEVAPSATRLWDEDRNHDYSTCRVCQLMQIPALIERIHGCVRVRIEVNNRPGYRPVNIIRPELHPSDGVCRNVS